MELEGQGSGGRKCCPLCQHPGCWYAESKPTKVKWPSGYTHYLAQLATRRKLCRTPQDPEDAHLHSYTVDGLPTLKVQTLTQDIAVEHRRCHTSPVPLEPGKLQPQHRHMKEAKQPLTLPRINYAQILLEEEEDECSDEIVLKRVLIWRPGQRKAHSILKGHSTGVAYDERHPPSLYTTSHEYECEPSSVRKGEPSTSVLKTERPHAIAVGTDQSSDTVKEGTCTGDRGPIPHESTRSSLKVYKTNLTDTLPPEEGHKVTIKTSTSLQQLQQRNPKRLPLPDAVSLSYLGDIDLPPQVVEEIIQQLRSESSTNTDAQYLNSPLRNEHASRVSPKSKHTSAHQSFAVSDHQSHGLSHRQVHNISTARLSAAAQRRLFQLTSFSRGLSIHPVDALKDYASHQRAKLSVPPYLADHKSCGWREVGDDISGLAVDSPPLRKHQLEPLNLQAAGRTTYLHARSSRQEKQRRQKSRREQSRVPSRRVAKDARNIVIPLQTANLAKAPCTVTLSLDPSSEHRITSHRSKEAKMSSRFLAVPKSHYSPSCNQSQSFSEDAPSTADSTQLFARGQSSKLSDSHTAGILKHSVLQHLSSPSPDYMLVAANFTDEGQLILTDREGVVTQHFATEGEEDSDEATESTRQDIHYDKFTAKRDEQGELQDMSTIQQDEVTARQDELTMQQGESTRQDKCTVQQDKSTVRKDVSSVHQDESSTYSAHQDEFFAYQDESSTHQDKLSAHQDEFFAHQDESSTHQDKLSAHQDELYAHQDKMSVHQDELSAQPHEPAIGKEELTLTRDNPSNACTSGQEEVSGESSPLNDIVPAIPAGIRAPPPSAVEEMRKN